MKIFAQRSVILVCYLGNIGDPSVVPEVYIVPSLELDALIYKAPGGRRVIPLSMARKEGGRFRDAWTILLKPNEASEAK